jgi:shikimate dehydrogenase
MSDHSLLLPGSRAFPHCTINNLYLKMRLFGLIGYPLGHSFSKQYFTQKFEKECVADVRYELFPIPEVALLPRLLREHPDLCGLNVTIPHKQAVLPFLHDLDDTARGVGAVNVIKIQNGRFVGYNSDVYGFEHSLLDWLDALNIVKKGAKSPNPTLFAFVPGTGGASKAVAYVLKKNGIPFTFVSRQPSGENELSYGALESRIPRDGFCLWINTTPVGTHPNTEQMPELPLERFDGRHLVYDLVYNPPETLLLRSAAERGALVKNGLDMLHLQAERAWTIWNE